MPEKQDEQATPAISTKPPRNSGRFQKGQTGNPAGRPRRDASRAVKGATLELGPAGVDDATRNDAGWHSMLSGLGTARDKRRHIRFSADPIDWDTARELYRGDPFAARIVEIPPNEMVREGYELRITNTDQVDKGANKPDDEGRETDDPELKPRSDRRARLDAAESKDLAEDIEHEWKELGLLKAIWEALCYERAYGGAAILLGIDDGVTDLTKPVAWGNIKGIKFVTALEPREIQPVAWYADPQAPKFGDPAIYQLTTSVNGATVDNKTPVLTARIHESRLLIFHGVRVTKRVIANMGGWGDSIFTRVFNMLRDFNISYSSTATLIADFAQAVYKMEGLNELLVEDPNGIFKKRAEGMNLARDVMNLIMIDGKDTFERQQTPVSGLADLIDRMDRAMSAVADIPLAFFMGESPGGLNASGASNDQLRAFYDKMKSKAVREVVPQLSYVVRLQFAARKVEPDEWCIEPRPLWQLTEAEDVAARKAQMEVDIGYIDRGVYSEVETRESRFGGDGYSYATQLRKDEPGDANAEAVYRAELAAGGDGATVPGGAGSAGGASNVAATAMNGAQITSLIEIVTTVNTKTISRASGIEILKLAFKVDDAEAARLLGPETFEPVVPPPPPSPFGGGGSTPGGKPSAPSAKPDAPAPPDAPASPDAPPKPETAPEQDTNKTESPGK